MVCTIHLPALIFVLLSADKKAGQAYTYGLPLQQHTVLHSCSCRLLGWVGSVPHQEDNLTAQVNTIGVHLQPTLLLLNHHPVLETVRSHCCREARGSPRAQSSKAGTTP